jgi:hypothetical protein
VSIGSIGQGSLFWLQNTEGEPLVGVFATNHHPKVLPPYFAAKKENPGIGFMPTNEMYDTYIHINKYRDKTFVDRL